VPKLAYKRALLKLSGEAFAVGELLASTSASSSGCRTS